VFVPRQFRFAKSVSDLRVRGEGGRGLLLSELAGGFPDRRFGQACPHLFQEISYQLEIVLEQGTALGSEKGQSPHDRSGFIVHRTDAITMVLMWCRSLEAASIAIGI
jgi:hypothetical protein